MATSVDPIYATPDPFTEFPGKGLPDIKQYITTHNAQGEGVFLPSDNGDHQALMANGRGVQNILYTTQGAAVDLNGEVDIAIARENKGTVIQGEFEVELDSGEKRTIRPGDVLVQRATAHKWRNLSPDNPGRILFVLLDCQPLIPINGKEFKVELNELQPDFPTTH
ncbi:hypothetical protein VTI28DRAFT_4439 [Corynascus sepedonium]